MGKLEIQHLYASYLRNGSTPPLEILRGACFSAGEGQVVAVRGASGSGKSTFLAIIGGMLKPSGGNVLYDGSDIYGWSDPTLSTFRARKVGFLFQLDFLLPNYSVAENVEMALHYAGRRTGVAGAPVNDVLVRVGLSARRDHLPDELSGGERHRAALARAVVHEPRLILADEPTGNLDRESASQILELLWQQRAGGAIVLIATHDDWVADQADRVVTLRGGLIIEESR